MGWPELMKTILHQESIYADMGNIDWPERYGILRRNPVRAIGMFNYRFHCFLRGVSMSPVQQIGKIKCRLCMEIFYI